MGGPGSEIWKGTQLPNCNGVRGLVGSCFVTSCVFEASDFQEGSNKEPHVC